MPPLIFVVEDNEKILENLRMILEFNEYRVITALNGVDALNILETIQEIPSLILSDIIMPKMDGYDFFKIISQNPKYLHVPFIFVTARSEPEDIRLGKLLGVDDYITKPFKEDDLLAVISGKINRNKKIRVINEKLTEIINVYRSDIYESKRFPQVEIFLLTIWDDAKGPYLLCSFPDEAELKDFPISISELSIQLYNSVSVIFGREHVLKARDLLLKIENIHKDGYIFFDAYKNPKLRGGQQIFMVALIAEKITYLESLSLKKIFLKVSEHFKKVKKCKNFENYWAEIQDSFSKMATS